MRSRIRKQPATRPFYRLSGLPEIRKLPRSGKLAQPPETQGATRLEAEVGMQLPACRKSENTAQREIGTAAGDARSIATGGGGGNAASGLPEIRKLPRSGKLAQPPETQRAARLEAEVGMQLPACRKSETLREAANWHSRRRRKEQRDWRRRWESNPRMTVLQTIALPLGYSAVRVARERFGSGGAGLCQRVIREIALSRAAMA